MSETSQILKGTKEDILEAIENIFLDFWNSSEDKIEELVESQIRDRFAEEIKQHERERYDIKEKLELFNREFDRYQKIEAAADRVVESFLSTSAYKLGVDGDIDLGTILDLSNTLLPTKDEPKTAAERIYENHCRS